jgi:hypothetical protein
MTSLFSQVWNEMYGQAYSELIGAPKARATTILNNQIKCGNVTPEYCNYADCVDHDTHPYWADYEHPLDVLWFCKKHLKQLEAEDKKQAVLQWAI